MMEIREYTVYREEEILPLYASVGWTAYTDDPEALREGFFHSLLTLDAYQKGRLLGLDKTGSNAERYTHEKQEFIDKHVPVDCKKTACSMIRF